MAGTTTVAAYMAETTPVARRALKQLRTAIKIGSPGHHGADQLSHPDVRSGRPVAPYRAGKGTLRFPLDAPIPADLVAKLAKVRVCEPVRLADPGSRRIAPDASSSFGAIMDFPHLVLARVYEHIEPIDRGDRYEGPLQATLETMGIGRVTGGGSQLDELGSITYADVEIELADVDGALRIVAEALEAAGAPQGAELINASDNRVLPEFGKLQCLAIYLDGTSLPDEVYAELHFEATVAAIGAAAGDDSYSLFSNVSRSARMLE